MKIIYLTELSSGPATASRPGSGISQMASLDFYFDVEC